MSNVPASPPPSLVVRYRDPFDNIERRLSYWTGDPVCGRPRVLVEEHAPDAHAVMGWRPPSSGAVITAEYVLAFTLLHATKHAPCCVIEQIQGVNVIVYDMRAIVIPVAPV